ncbi:MAG: isoprenylcysteine carboxylmethyltransferase family protein, partial [Sphingomonadales bacterium]
MARLASLFYGVVVYFFFFATFLYLIGFVGDAAFLPTTINRGEPLTDSSTVAVIINLVLIALFGIQHSVMARSGFKAAWTRIIPPPVERSTYVLMTSLILILLFFLWQPLPQTIWLVEAEAGAIVLWALFFLGWGLLLLATFTINHFDLFGLRQVWFHFRSTPEPPIPFKVSGL